MKKYDICVFGGCSLDMTFFQKKDGTYSLEPDISTPGGKGANQAVASSRAGAKVAIISKVGKDEIGYKIVDNLRKNNVCVNFIEMVEGLKNDCSKIYIEKDNKDNEIIRENGAIDSFSIDMIEKYKEVLLSSKIVVAQMKIPKEVSIALIEFCNKNNIPLIITPCRPDKLKISEEGNYELIDKISYITANKKECSTIFETDNIISVLKKYPNKLIVTLGSEGLIYYDGKNINKIDAIKVDKIVDTTGAGDTFNGNLAALLSKNVPLSVAIEKAQYASALKLSKEGAQDGMPYKEELNTFIRKCNSKGFNYKEEFNMIYEKIIEANELNKNRIQMKITRKEDKTFVTESDLFIENFLINKILEVYPNDNFVSEESNSLNSIKNRTWIIDPIDGTHHYMKNSIFWGTQVAFVDNDEVQFSIIYLLKLNEIYYALNGFGTFLNNQKTYLKDDVKFEECNVEFCGSIHKEFEEKAKILKEITLKDERVANVMHINSCCIAFTNLISGRTDALVLSTKKIWDVLPGAFLLKEYGIEKINIGNLSLYSKSNSLKDKIIKIN